MVVSSRQGPTDDISTGSRGCTLGENFLFMKFKMAASEYSQIQFSPISLAIIDIETLF